MDAYQKNFGEPIDKKHAYFKTKEEDWELCRMAYEGGKEFIEYALHRHSRETYKNWRERIKEGVDFNYAAAIVDLFNFYLVEKPSTREFIGYKYARNEGDITIKRQIKRSIDGFEKDLQWQMFLRDSDLLGTNFDIFLNHAQKTASVGGSAGILINKPRGRSSNIDQEVRNRIYPYCTKFDMLHIYDWKYSRNKDTGRLDLVYLKLKETETEYLLWWRNRWERWEITEKKDTRRIGAGLNPLNEIPFVWLINLKGIDPTHWYHGISDIKEVSRIVASLIRNYSCGEEMLKFCGFPMLLMPMEEDDGESNDEVGSGVTAVHEFDPEHGDGGKPSWLEPKILESIDALLKWTDRKTDEIYRTAHLSGVHGQRKSNNEVASGLALRYEFQQLNSVLIEKGSNLSEAETQILRFWLKWQNRSDAIDRIRVRRPKAFSVDELAMELDNIFDSIEKVYSKTFRKIALKKVAQTAMPDTSDTDVELINKEIDDAVDNGEYDVNPDDKAIINTKE